MSDTKYMEYGLICQELGRCDSGLRATPFQRKFSYRTSPTAFIDLKNCEIPQANILPTAHGLKPVFQCLNHARYGVACGALGSSIACYQTARDFAVKRQVFDRPVASYQLVQDQLTRMLIEITKAQLVSFHLGRLLDGNQAKPPQISLAKLNNVREAMKIARLARDITGARGILAEAEQKAGHIVKLKRYSEKTLRLLDAGCCCAPRTHQIHRRRKVIFCWIIWPGPRLYGLPRMNTSSGMN